MPDHKVQGAIRYSLKGTKWYIFLGHFSESLHDESHAPVLSLPLAVLLHGPAQDAPADLQGFLHREVLLKNLLNHILLAQLLQNQEKFPEKYCSFSSILLDANI